MKTQLLCGKSLFFVVLVSFVVPLQNDYSKATGHTRLHHLHAQ